MRIVKIAAISFAAVIAGIIAIAVVAGVLSSGGGSNPDTTEKPPGVSQGVGSKEADDVKGGEMRTPYGTVEIPVTITNHSSKASDYNIEATVYDAQGNQVDTAGTFVQRVAPHGKAHSKLLGVEGSEAATYKLTLVERTASL